MSSLCKTRLNMDVIILQKRKKESFQMIIINHELENCIYNVLLLYCCCCQNFFFFSSFPTSFESENMFSTGLHYIFTYNKCTLYIKNRWSVLQLWHLSFANEGNLASISLLAKKKSQQKKKNKWKHQGGVESVALANKHTILKLHIQRPETNYPLSIEVKHLAERRRADIHRGMCRRPAYHNCCHCWHIFLSKF